MISKAHQPKRVTLTLKPVYFLLIILSLAYLLLIYKNTSQFNPLYRSRRQYFIINASVAIPEIAIWAVAFTSSVKLKHYSKSINKSMDGIAMKYMADALIFMAIYLVLICTAGEVTDLFRGTSFLRKSVLIENYVPLIIIFVSSVFLLLAGRHFNSLVKLSMSRLKAISIAALFIILTGLFTWHFIEINPGSIVQNGMPKFISSDTVLVATYVLPLIIVWAIGLFACICINNYSSHVKGSIYKKMLASLYKGVLIVFVCTFLAQMFILSNLNINGFSLGLVLVYGLLLVGGLGFTYIYKGSGDLSKLESV